MRGVAHQHPSGTAQPIGLGQCQRPGRHPGGQLQRACRAACGVGQRRLELGHGHLLHSLGANRRHRPNQRVAASGFRAIQRQQRQHIGRAEPLSCHAEVGIARHQAGGQRRVAIGLDIEANPQRLSASRCLALGEHAQRGAGSLGRPISQADQVRRKSCGGSQRSVEFGRIDDPCQRVDALLPGREIDHTAGAVALDMHVVDRRDRIGGQRIPDLELGQQRARRRVERIGANIRQRPRRGASISGTDQPDPQALSGQRQPQRQPHCATATDAHIEGRHRAHCRNPGPA